MCVTLVSVRVYWGCFLYSNMIFAAFQVYKVLCTS